jgi:hypothetical protein
MTAGAPGRPEGTDRRPLGASAQRRPLRVASGAGPCVPAPDVTPRTI